MVKINALSNTRSSFFKDTIYLPVKNSISDTNNSEQIYDDDSNYLDDKKVNIDIGESDTNSLNNDSISSSSDELSLDEDSSTIEIDGTSNLKLDGKKISFTDSEGNTFVMTIDEYRNSLKEMGLTDVDADRVISGGESLDAVLNEILLDEDPTRREQLYSYQYFLQTKYSCSGYENVSVEDISTTLDDLQSTKTELQVALDGADDATKEKINADIAEIDSYIDALTDLSSQLDSINYYNSLLDGVDSYDDLLEKIDGMQKEYDELMAQQNALKSNVEALKTEGGVVIQTASGTQYSTGNYDEYNAAMDALSDFNSKHADRIAELALALSVCNSIKTSIETDSYERAELLDSVEANADFNAHSTFNGLDGYDSIIYKKYSKGKQEHVDESFELSIADEAEMLAYILNGKVNFNDNYLQGDNGTYRVTSADGLVQHYAKWLTEGRNDGIITDEEIEVFNYIYNTKGAEAAIDFLEKLEDIVDARYYSIKTRHDQEYADSDPFGASFGSVIFTPYEGLQAIFASLNHKIFDDKLLRTDVYSSGDVWRVRVSSNIYRDYGEGWSLVYNTGMSIADTVELIGLDAVTGGSMRGILAFSTMGSRAYVSTINDALDRGIDADTAILLAASAAFAESAMESYSLGHFANLERNLGTVALSFKGKVAEVTGSEAATKIANCVAMAVSQGLVEGEEEFATDILNYMFDEIIAGKLSNSNISVENYMLQGYSEAEAKEMYTNDFLRQLQQSFLGGFVSGICFGSFSAIKSTHSASEHISIEMMNDYDSRAEALSVQIDAESEARAYLEDLQYDIKADQRRAIASDFKNYISNLKTRISELGAGVAHDVGTKLASEDGFLNLSGVFGKNNSANAAPNNPVQTYAVNVVTEKMSANTQSYLESLPYKDNIICVKQIHSSDLQSFFQNGVALYGYGGVGRNDYEVDLDSAVYPYQNYGDLVQNILNSYYGKSAGGNLVDGAIVIIIPRSQFTDYVTPDSSIVQIIDGQMYLKPEYIDSFISVSSDGTFGEVVTRNSYAAARSVSHTEYSQNVMYIEQISKILQKKYGWSEAKALNYLKDIVISKDASRITRENGARDLFTYLRDNGVLISSFNEYLSILQQSRASRQVSHQVDMSSVFSAIDRFGESKGIQNYSSKVIMGMQKQGVNNMLKYIPHEVRGAIKNMSLNDIIKAYSQYNNPQSVQVSGSSASLIDLSSIITSDSSSTSNEVKLDNKVVTLSDLMPNEIQDFSADDLLRGFKNPKMFSSWLDDIENYDEFHDLYVKATEGGLNVDPTALEILSTINDRYLEVISAKNEVKNAEVGKDVKEIKNLQNVTYFKTIVSKGSYSSSELDRISSELVNAGSDIAAINKILSDNNLAKFDPQTGESFANKIALYNSILKDGKVNVDSLIEFISDEVHQSHEDTIKQLRAYVKGGNMMYIPNSVRDIVSQLDFSQISNYFKIKDNMHYMEIIIGAMMDKYGYDEQTAILTVRKCIEGGNPNFITEFEGARSLLTSMSRSDASEALDEYVKSHITNINAYSVQQYDSIYDEALRENEQFDARIVQQVISDFNNIVIAGNNFDYTISQNFSNIVASNQSEMISVSSDPNSFELSKIYLSMLVNEISSNPEGLKLLKKLIKIKQNNPHFSVLTSPMVDGSCYHCRGVLFMKSTRQAWHDIGVLCHELGHAVHYLTDNLRVPAEWDSAVSQLNADSNFMQKIKNMSVRMADVNNRLASQAFQEMNLGDAYNVQNIRTLDDVFASETFREEVNITYFQMKNTSDLRDYLIRICHMNSSDADRFISNVSNLSNTLSHKLLGVNQNQIDQLYYQLAFSMHKINLEKAVYAQIENYQRNSTTNTSALCDILSALVGGRRASAGGAHVLSDGSLVDLPFSHNYDNYYGSDSRLVFLEVFANFVQLKATGNEHDLYVLEDVIGPRTYRIIESYYNSIML